MRCILFSAHLQEINRVLLLAPGHQRASKDSWVIPKRRMFYLETSRGGRETPREGYARSRYFVPRYLEDKSSQGRLDTEYKDATAFHLLVSHTRCTRNRHDMGRRGEKREGHENYCVLRSAACRCIATPFSSSSPRGPHPYPTCQPSQAQPSS